MSPEELQRYRELKDKLKQAMDESPARSVQSPEGLQSCLKSPEHPSRRLNRMVTYSPMAQMMNSSNTSPQNR